MAVFSVDTDSLLGASAEFTGSCDRLRAEVAYLMNTVQSLEGTWAGGAASSFRELVTRWQAMQINVEELLADLTHRLSTVTSGYVEVEMQSTSMFR